MKASQALEGITPLQAPSGDVTDISTFLYFSFYEFYYETDKKEPDSACPSNSNEKCGYWLGFAEDKRDQLTWKMLTEDTH